MPAPKKQLQYINIFVLFTILFCVSCMDKNTLENKKSASLISSKSSQRACVDIEGIVRGDIRPGSEVFLHKVYSHNFSIVMSKIRKDDFTAKTCVNASGKFYFKCLDIGKFVFAVQASSFNRSWGAPLPFEFDCENFSVKIAFQGGDSSHMVGAFSIYNPSIDGINDCVKAQWPCPAKRGNLYVECPLTQS